MKKFSQIVILLVLLTGCPSNDWLRDTSVKWDVSLVEREVTDLAEAKKHLLPEGLIVYLWDPPGTEKELYIRAKRQADGAYMQGMLLAAMSFKYKTTKDPEDKKFAQHLWDAAHKLVTMSGYPGLVARSYGKDDPADPEYYVRKDGSGDGLTGWIFGANAFWHCIDDPVRKQQIAEDLKAICLHLRKHNLKIYEHEGKPTPYGDFKTPVMGVPIGHYGIAMMALANLAVKAFPNDEQVKDFLNWLVQKDYHRQAQYFYSWFPHHADNTTAYFLNQLVAWMSDETPHRRKFYKIGIESAWQRAGTWQMAFYALVYKSVTGDDSSRVQDAIERLRNVPPYYARVVNQQDNEKSHDKVVPMEDRPVTAFFWTNSPYREIKHEGAPRTKERYARTDFLMAYWLGRSLGEYKNTSLSK